MMLLYHILPMIDRAVFPPLSAAPMRVIPQPRAFMQQGLPEPVMWWLGNDDHKDAVSFAQFFPIMLKSRSNTLSL
jgi:hypothetical protein